MTKSGPMGCEQTECATSRVSKKVAALHFPSLVSWNADRTVEPQKRNREKAPGSLDGLFPGLSAYLLLFTNIYICIYICILLYFGVSLFLGV